MAPIIEIKNIGKKYNITHERGRYIALRDVIMNTVKSPLAFIKSKTRKIVGLEQEEEYWALKDINLSVEKGEVIGIIGRNGAGKSTLLKILSQITPPSEGEIVLRGRVGSLLEVGTGFHPELTGRENIFLNGAILGMSRSEVSKKFEEIVEFADIRQFLDTPIKRYSSGMYVRLAFSVAAHMEPDILLIDEVLAVGDTEFQKKCLGKMDELTKKSGRTIIFVSHNMITVEQLCKKVIILKKGRIDFIGPVKEGISKYLNPEHGGSNQVSWEGVSGAPGNGDCPHFVSVSSRNWRLSPFPQRLHTRRVCRRTWRWPRWSRWRPQDIDPSAAGGAPGNGDCPHFPGATGCCRVGGICLE